MAEVLGDTERDIFDGLALGLAVFSAPRYLAAEHVTNIVEGFGPGRPDDPGARPGSIRTRSKGCGLPS